MLLGDMAKMLGISVPYLSQLETGQRFVPDGFEDKVIKSLAMPASEANELSRAAALSRSQFSIPMGRDVSEDDRSLAFDLAEAFAKLSPQAKEKLRKVIQEDGDA